MNFISLKVLYKSILDGWDLRNKRTSYVISGLAPTATGAGSLGITVATGTAIVNGTFVNYAGGSAGTSATADPINPRVDVVRIASGAAVPSIITGTAAAQPVAPAMGANDLLVGIAFIPATATDFTASGAYVEDMTMRRSEIVTTKGDIVASDTNGVQQRLAVGTNTQVLTADSAQTLGVKWATPSGASGGTPAVVLGTANAAGVAATFLRDDDTILVFDTTVPNGIGTAAVGTATTAARRDHQHPTAAVAPVATAYANATGAGPGAAMTDHVHKVALTSAQTFITGNVSINNAVTYVDIASLGSLAAGTWLVTVMLVWSSTSVNNLFDAKVWDGTTTLLHGEFVQLAAANQRTTATLAGIITLGGAATIKVSGVDSASAGTVFANAQGTSNTASGISAVRIA